MESLIKNVKVWLLTVMVMIGWLAGYPTANVSSRYTDEELAAYTQAARDAGPGMIIAMGGGFDYEDTFRPLIDKCLSHVNRETPHMLFIPTGHFDELEETEEIVEWFANAGCRTDILLPSKTTEQEVKEKIAWADIIYETGGNLKFVADTWREKGVMDAVKAAFARGAVLMGVSTGAMCWAEKGWDNFGEPVFRVTDEFPFLGEEPKYEFCDATGLLPFCLCPHFDNVAWRIYGFEAVRQDFPSLCIENGAAVVFCDGAYEVIADVKTPRRTAYLFCPEKNIVMLDVAKNAALVSAIDGERRGG